LDSGPVTACFFLPNGLEYIVHVSPVLRYFVSTPLALLRRTRASFEPPVRWCFLAAPFGLYPVPLFDSISFASPALPTLLSPSGLLAPDFPPILPSFRGDLEVAPSLSLMFGLVFNSRRLTVGPYRVLLLLRATDSSGLIGIEFFSRHCLKSEFFSPMLPPSRSFTVRIYVIHSTMSQR